MLRYPGSGPGRLLSRAACWLCLGGALAAQETAQPAAQPAGNASAASAPATPVKPPAVEEVPPELQPYDVLVAISVDDGTGRGADYREDLADVVAERLEAWFGPMWSLTVGPDESGAPVVADQLQRFSEEELNERYLPGKHDKVFLVSVHESGARVDVSVREWDRSRQAAGPAIDESTFDVRSCADVITQSVRRAFRPVAMVNQVDEAGGVELMIRAGEFLAGDDDALPFRAGDYLVPFVRYLNKQREVQQIQPLPWTLLQVESVDRARMQCKVISAFKSPISASRRRIELVAMAARPVFPETVLRISPRSEPNNPTVGCRVEILDRLPTADDPVEDRVTIYSDRRGGVLLAADPAQPLRYVLVHSGQAVLARVPVIAGLEPEMDLYTPDDAARLGVEGALSLLEGELIDTVARRAVLMVRARKAAKEKKWEDVDRYLQQIDELPTLDDVRERVDAIRLPAVMAAEEENDRVAEARIKKVCSDFAGVAEQHMDAQKIKDFKDEMSELRASSR